MCIWYLFFCILLKLNLECEYVGSFFDDVLNDDVVEIIESGFKDS